MKYKLTFVHLSSQFQNCFSSLVMVFQSSMVNHLWQLGQNVWLVVLLIVWCIGSTTHPPFLAKDSASTHRCSARTGSIPAIASNAARNAFGSRII